MSLYSVFGVLSGVKYVAPRGVSMVCSLFMMAGVVMLGGFAVVVGCVGKMF